jgi:hypothetical protein
MVDGVWVGGAQAQLILADPVRATVTGMAVERVETERPAWQWARPSSRRKSRAPAVGTGALDKTWSHALEQLGRLRLELFFGEDAPIAQFA